MSDKLKFRVKDGRKFGQGTDEESEAGEVVELTAEQASGFMDILEPVEKGSSKNVTNAAYRISLESKTVTQLKQMDEWKEVPEPKPTGKAKIIAAILKVSE